MSDDGYGCGFGDGYGDGYGNGCGCGFGNGYGNGNGYGAPCGRIGGFSVFVVRPWSLVMVGCEAHTLAHWRRHWRDIARAQGANVTEKEARAMLAKCEAMK